MVFKRGRPRTYTQIVTQTVYPRGGWGRASRYIVHRLRRLPDPAHKISRGIACGVFICFTPFFGFHFIMSAALAWAIRGNVLAAILSTFFGNPITFPFIAAISMEVGTWMLGSPPVPLNRVGEAFSQAFLEFWHNVTAIFTPATAHWDQFGAFMQVIFMPYLVGGLIPGLIAGIAAYYLSYPIIVTYKKARARRQETKRRKKAQAAMRGDEGPA